MSVLASVLVCLFDPLCDVLEGVTVGKVKDNEGSHCSVVVGLGDGSEAFLTCSVPNLATDILVVDFKAFGGELDPDGGLLIEEEGVVDKLGNQVGFSDSGIADHHYLE